MDNSNQQESVQEQTVADDAAPAVSELPGRRLRETRESNHLSCDEVAHHLRLDVQLIQALEQDDYSDMPSPAYICGYLRSYARLLKLPEDEIVQAYSHGEQINAALIPSSVNIESKKPINVPFLKPMLVIIIIALLAWGGYFLVEKYKIFSGGLFSKKGVQTQQESELLVPPAPTPAKHPPKAAKTAKPASVNEPKAIKNQTAPAKNDSGVTMIEKLPIPKANIPAEEPDTATGQNPPPAAAANKAATQQSQASAKTATLRMHFTGNSWVEVTDATNNRLVYQLALKDTDLNLDGVPPFKIVLGNAPAVQVFYKGKEFDHSNYHKNQVANFTVGTKQANTNQ